MAKSVKKKNETKFQSDSIELAEKMCKFEDNVFYNKVFFSDIRTT